MQPLTFSEVAFYIELLEYRRDAGQQIEGDLYSDICREAYGEVTPELRNRVKEGLFYAMYRGSGTTLEGGRSDNDSTGS